MFPSVVDAFTHTHPTSFASKLIGFFRPVAIIIAITLVSVLVSVLGIIACMVIGFLFYLWHECTTIWVRVKMWVHECWVSSVPIYTSALGNLDQEIDPAPNASQMTRHGGRPAANPLTDTRKKSVRWCVRECGRRSKNAKSKLQGHLSERSKDWNLGLELTRMAFWRSTLGLENSTGS